MKSNKLILETYYEVKEMDDGPKDFKERKEFYFGDREDLLDTLDCIKIYLWKTYGDEKIILKDWKIIYEL